MAKTQDIKRRIRSIRNTMQLTRAMKMVSAAKLRRAQQRILSARPYAHRTLAVLRSLATRANPELNPLLEERGDRRVEVIVVTSDRGLCGSFNAAILRKAEELLRELSEREVAVAALGKKARDYFVRRHHAVERRWVDVFRTVEYATAAEVAQRYMDRYTARETDRIYLVYNEFKSAIQARPVVQQLLPVERLDTPGDVAVEDYIYEPDAETLLARLLPHYVRHAVYLAMLESSAAEHAARMTAMESATKNAGELIESLTLTMNRVRQASITTEIIEVVSGAEALG